MLNIAVANEVVVVFVSSQDQKYISYVTIFEEKIYISKLFTITKKKYAHIAKLYLKIKRLM